MNDDTGRLFLERSRHQLRDEYLPKLTRALEVMETVWPAAALQFITTR